MTGDVTYSPATGGTPTLDQLIARRDLLVAYAFAAQRGDQETLEVFEAQLRGEPKLARREVRNRINRTAAVGYWREVRQTEERIGELQRAASAAEDVNVKISYDDQEDPQAKRPAPI